MIYASSLYTLRPMRTAYRMVCKISSTKLLKRIFRLVWNFCLIVQGESRKSGHCQPLISIL
jgi:hypothetical protein